MLQSIIVYGFLITSMYLLGSLKFNFSKRNKKKDSFWKLNVVLSLLIFTLISALRYDVGVDYMYYLESFQSISDSFDIYDNSKFEIGYNFIQKKIYNLGLHSSFLFGFLAFLKIFLIYYNFKREQFLYGCLSFIIITSGIYFTMMNEMRQTLVVCLFLYAIQFANKKDAFKYFLIAFLGYYIHTSALFFIPIFFVVIHDKDFFKSIGLQLILLGLFLSIDGSDFIFDFLRDYSYLINQFASKENYIDIYSRINIWERDYIKGSRYFLKMLIFLLIIINSKKIKFYFNSKNFIKYYNLFFIGCLSYILTYNNTLLQRPARFFMLFELVVGGYALFYFIKRNKKFAFIYIFLSILFFSAIVYSDHHTFYNFFWQS